jgi:hypothetical protein
MDTTAGNMLDIVLAPQFDPTLHLETILINHACNSILDAIDLAAMLGGNAFASEELSVSNMRAFRVRHPSPDDFTSNGSNQFARPT